MAKQRSPLVVVIVMQRRDGPQRKASRSRQAKLAAAPSMESNGWYWTDLKGPAVSMRSVAARQLPGRANRARPALAARCETTWEA